MSYTKLHTEAWLRGSIRKYPPEIRGVWCDLQAMAGESIYTGFVCISPQVGYLPEQLAKVFNLDTQILVKSLGIFAQEKYIEIDQNGVIKLTDWSQYQSEYQRLNAYKKGTRKGTKKGTKKYTEKYTRSAVSVSVSDSLCVSEDKRKTIPPLLEWVKEYCAERKNSVDAQKFVDHYEARGWLFKNGSRVKDWQATVRTWERSGFNDKTASEQKKEMSEAAKIQKWRNDHYLEIASGKIEDPYGKN